MLGMLIYVVAQLNIVPEIKMLLSIYHH